MEHSANLGGRTMPASFVEVTCVGSAATSPALSDLKTAVPIRSPRRGGTAFPICRKAAVAGPAKRAPIRERLQPRSFSNRDRSVLGWMDIPVTVLGDVGRNTAAWRVQVETLVLVVEDVISVALQLIRYL